MDFNRSFASDNYAGAHPEVLRAIGLANLGHARAYGDDLLTRKAEEKFSDLFGPEARAFFVFNGTAANTLAISSLARSYESVLAPSSAHIHMDECGAPEFITGSKLISLPAKDGKILASQISAYCQRLGDIHSSQPKVVSISQPTECGTLYSIEELRNLCKEASKYGLYVHVDGSRIANALASLNLSAKEMFVETGVSALSFGGTKNGMLYGEAVVFLKPELGTNFKYVRKQSMQLSSKMRFLSAQFLALFENELWLRNARHANEMAKVLWEKLQNIEGVRIPRKTQVNSVFAILPKSAIEKIQREYFFYVWDENPPETLWPKRQNLSKTAATDPFKEVRWMCAWDTRPEEVEDFVAVVKAALS